MRAFDVFIIGGGPAGQDLARACNASGMSVGIAEYRGFGGTCGLRGCDPKRVMVSVSEAVDGVDRLVGHGVEGEATLVWDDVRAFVAEFVKPKPEAARANLESEGITTFTAKASFVSADRLRVGDEEVSASKIVIATGQRPAPLGIPGEELAKTSDDFHGLEALPARILFIGGGYIGLESAHICARAGCRVTVVNSDDDPLPMFERAFADRLVQASEELGIEFVMNASAEKIEEREDGFRVSVKTEDGSTRAFDDIGLVMNTAGRVANVEDLNLGVLGVEADGQGIKVDEYYRVGGHGNIFAIGDVANHEGAPLTPVAQLEAEALARTLTKGRLSVADYTGISTAVYTLPELAGVGLTEQQAREQDYVVEVIDKLDAESQFNARRVNARAYGYKTVTDAETGELLGATVIGPRASEIINLFALSIRAGIPTQVLSEMPWAYPTWGSDVAGMV